MMLTILSAVDNISPVDWIEHFTDGIINENDVEILFDWINIVQFHKWKLSRILKNICLCYSPLDESRMTCDEG